MIAFDYSRTDIKMSDQKLMLSNTLAASVVIDEWPANENTDHCDTLSSDIIIDSTDTIPRSNLQCFRISKLTIIFAFISIAMYIFDYFSDIVVGVDHIMNGEFNDSHSCRILTANPWLILRPTIPRWFYFLNCLYFDIGHKFGSGHVRPANEI